MFKQSFLKKLARSEDVPLEFLARGIAKGTIVAPINKLRALPKPVAIGRGLKIKINANIGTSTNQRGISDELKKLNTAITFGADTIMDLSVGGNLRKVRQRIMKESTVPVGTVPIYEIAREAERKKNDIAKITSDDIMCVLEDQAKSGVDFFTIHAGILQKAVNYLKRKKRVGGIVSRGGAILARWMHVNKRENPFYENFDELLEVAKKYNITLSLGDALRPGAIADSTDKAQLMELAVLGELVKRARRKKVQVMVEGPGHLKINEIGMNVVLEKKLCHGAPFYVLGPLVTDISAGYDHIAGAIGGALAGLYGVDFLCVVTPAEHLRHPSVQDIKEGVIASKIAAHAVDLLRFQKERMRDDRLSRYRLQRDWKNIFPLVFDEGKAKEYRNSLNTSSLDVCTMCGEFCSLKIIENCNLFT